MELKVDSDFGYRDTPFYDMQQCLGSSFGREIWVRKACGWLVVWFRGGYNMGLLYEVVRAPREEVNI